MNSSVGFSDIKIDQPVKIHMDPDPRKSRITINGEILPVNEIRFFIKDSVQMIDLRIYGFRARPFHVEARVTAVSEEDEATP